MLTSIYAPMGYADHRLDPRLSRYAEQSQHPYNNRFNKNYYYCGYSIEVEATSIDTIDQLFKYINIGAFNIIDKFELTQEHFTINCSFKYNYVLVKSNQVHINMDNDIDYKNILYISISKFYSTIPDAEPTKKIENQILLLI